ncbi:MAG: hypothetical protein V4582_12455 [Pseudomonadota bacterium]
MSIKHSVQFVQKSRNSAVAGDMVAPARPARREPDPAVGKMFANIHRNRSNFSVAAVTGAFSKLPVGKKD